MDESLVARGSELRRKMFGRPVDDAVLDREEPFADWQTLTSGVVYGQIWSRPGLDLRTRSLCTVAALTVLGHREQLRSHVRGALINGASKMEVAEVILQMAPYGGWPAAAAAVEDARIVFAELSK